MTRKISTGYKLLVDAMVAVSFVSREAQTVSIISSALVIGVKAIAS